MAIHESGQMYLETIYILSQNSTFVRAIDVGEQLGFTKPSVSRAMSILKKDGYVNVDADGAITLTETGLAIAKTMYTRHTVLSQMLMELPKRRFCTPSSRNDLCYSVCMIFNASSVDSFPAR